ncbi:MAG: S8 family serine peptidase, partial [Acidiferrobacterales bacterium]|nr:S8 family serine peptidase [Acidiferrobacterales bacterium]
MASIGGYAVENDPANGDVMAGFSSRGPQSVFDVLKPDVTAPGVDIFAADKNDDTPDPNDPEYQFLSGTSMSSPHNAGAGLLLSATNPDWTPTEIKSALMLTASNLITVKEDGETATDAFDLGAGRIDLPAANDAGLVMSESIENFLAADPALGGDPSTLNLASMMDSNCVGECSWTRTVTNTLDKTGYWNVVAVGDGFEAVVDIRPRSSSRNHNLVLKKGQSATIKISVDNYDSDDGWQFGMLKLDAQGNSNGTLYKSHETRKPANRHSKYYSNRFYNRDSSGSDLAMPIAVQASKATNAELFTKTVDAEQASKGDVLSYELNVTNGQAGGPITITDTIPKATKLIDDSLTLELVNGITTSEWSYDKQKKQLNWTGELDVGGLAVQASPAPFGYFSLGGFGGVPLEGCNGNCDDGGFFFTVPSFTFNGESYSEVLFSVNGTLEAGSESLQFTSFANQNLPDATVPNNIIAPFWRDLNLNQGGNMYIATLGLASGETWTIYEWENVPFYSDDPTAVTPAVTMQVWIGVDGTPVEGNIHFVYNRLDDTGNGGTVGVENSEGTIGTSYFFNGAGTTPTVGTDLLVSTLDGGSATLSFQVESKCRKGRIINSANLSNASFNEEAIAVTSCE